MKTHKNNKNSACCVWNGVVWCMYVSDMEFM